MASLLTLNDPERDINNKPVPRSGQGRQLTCVWPAAKRSE